MRCPTKRTTALTILTIGNPSAVKLYDVVPEMTFSVKAQVRQIKAGPLMLLVGIDHVVYT